MTTTTEPDAMQSERRSRHPALVVSFPKSGRTWVEMMLAKVQSLATGTPVRAFLADPDRPSAPGPGGARVEFTHGRGNDRICRGLGFTPETYAGRTVALLVRDPRDVLVSFYYYERFDGLGSFSGTLPEFLRYDPATAPEGSRAARYGIRAILHWMNAWAANREVPARLHVSAYEDFHRDPRAELRRLCDFLGLAAEPEALDAAIEFASFDNMRTLELSQELRWHGLRSAPDRRGLKTREGRVGGSREVLSADDARWLDEIIATELDPYFARYLGAPRR